MLFSGVAFAGVYLNTEGFLSALESAKSFTEHPEAPQRNCIFQLGDDNLLYFCRLSSLAVEVSGQPLQTGAADFESRANN